MLSEKMVRAREKRGWTVYEAARRTQVVHHHALAKLESGKTDPARTSIETALAVIWLYDGDIRLADFVAWAERDLFELKVKHKRGRKPKDPSHERHQLRRSPARSPRARSEDAS